MHSRGGFFSLFLVVLLVFSAASLERKIALENLLDLASTASILCGVTAIGNSPVEMGQPVPEFDELMNLQIK